MAALFLAGGLGAAGLGVCALVLPDWRRALTTNRAETDPRSPDPALRPLPTGATAGEIVAALERLPQRQPHWRFAGLTREPSGMRVALVRRTRWLRFSDDVEVTIEDSGQERRIAIRSRSRVGKADFGQNRRNIRELRAYLAEVLPPPGAVSG